MNSEPSLGRQIALALVGFPKYAVEWVLGFYIVLTNTELTALAVLSVLVGFETDWKLGVIVFLAAWLTLRTLNNLMVPLASALQRKVDLDRWYRHER